MSNRTDPHRPGAIIPADYDYLFSYSAPNVWSINFTDGDAGPHSARSYLGTGKLFRESLQNCHSCGAHFRHGDLWLHRPTGKVIAVGHICADKYSLMADRTGYERIRAIEIEKAERAEDKRRTLTDNDGLAKALACEHHIVRDISRRFDQYGTLSAKQIALVLKLDREAKERLARKAQEKKEHRDAPEGRQTITGEILSVKWHENGYGGADKATIKVAKDGGFFLVWVTLPAAIGDEFIREMDGCPLHKMRGTVVTLTANLSRSDRDSHFCFGKRPSKASIVSLPAELVEARDKERAERALVSV